MTNIWRKPFSMRAISGSTAHGALVAMVVIAFAAGCQRKPSATTSADVAAPDPKAIFDEFFKTFRHEIVSDLPQFATMKDGNFSSLKTNRTVSHELFPPTDADATYRANITIKTETQFTFRPAQKEGGADQEDDGKTTDESPEGSGFGLPALGGFEELGVVGPAASPGEGFPAGPLPPQKNEDEQVYELAFENGRWVLKTEPDPETERFIKATFDFVLSNQ